MGTLARCWRRRNRQRGVRVLSEAYSTCCLGHCCLALSDVYAPPRNAQIVRGAVHTPCALHIRTHTAWSAHTYSFLSSNMSSSFHRLSCYLPLCAGLCLALCVRARTRAYAVDVTACTCPSVSILLSSSFLLQDQDDYLFYSNSIRAI